jgi:hypothetical protein
MFRLFLAIVLVAATSALTMSRTAVLASFNSGNALKVISGINQFDATLVKNVVAAACQGGASHVDIACDPALVRLAKQVSGEMPVCVSSIKPIDFVAAVEAGAGWYFHTLQYGRQGIFFLFFPSSFRSHRAF